MMLLPSDDSSYKCSNDISIYDYRKSGKKLKKYKPEDKYVDFDLMDQRVLLHGNIKFSFIDHDAYGQDSKVTRAIHGFS